MENSMDMTSVVNTFTSNGHSWISLGLVILTIVIIPMFKHWIKRENEIHKADIKRLEDKIAEHEKRFENGNTRFSKMDQELKEIRNDLKEIMVDTGKISTAMEFIKERLK